MTDTSNEIDATSGTKGLPDDVRLPGSESTLGELRELIAKMRKYNEQFYWTLFGSGIGASAHAFIEFCGLQSAYIDVCEAALDSGIDFTQANVHSGGRVPLPAHKVAYIAEKFGCIFGHAIGDDHELREIFILGALGLAPKKDEGSEP